MAEQQQAENPINSIVGTERERGEEILVNPPAEKPAKSEEDETPDYQKVADKLGNEVGELRKELKNAYARMEEFTLAQNQPEPEPQVSYEEDPGRFIQQAIDKVLEERLGPQLQVLNSDLQRRVSGEFESEMNESQPGWQDVVNSDDFGNWLKVNPAMTTLVEKAARQFDVSSATEVVKRFKQDQELESKNRMGAFNAAAMSSGGSGEGAARIYAASEIQRMKSTDPEGYRLWLAGDGYTAYSEGRVRRGT